MTIPGESFESIVSVHLQLGADLDLAAEGFRRWIFSGDLQQTLSLIRVQRTLQ